MSEDKLPEEFVNYLRKHIKEAIQNYFKSREELKVFEEEFKKLVEKGWSPASVVNSVILEAHKIYDEEGKDLPPIVRELFKEQFTNALFRFFK